MGELLLEEEEEELLEEEEEGRFRFGIILYGRERFYFYFFFYSMLWCCGVDFLWKREKVSEKEDQFEWFDNGLWLWLCLPGDGRPLSQIVEELENHQNLLIDTE